LSEKSEMNRPLRKPRRIWEFIINVDLEKQIGCVKTGIIFLRAETGRENL
jgi:hypothetical protein